MSVWQKCLEQLQKQITAQQYNTWIRPLHAVESDSEIQLLAPNRFVLERVKDDFIRQITDIIISFGENTQLDIKLQIGSKVHPEELTTIKHNHSRRKAEEVSSRFRRSSDNSRQPNASNLNPLFTFNSFVEGKSNELAKAASLQVAENPGTAYNPLFIYGGVGLGKTHLMHAVGNMLEKKNQKFNIVYLSSERFVADMVKALQHNTINEFKRFYRTVDALLIDDIQFFSRKERSQEEFFHTFNALLEGQQQVIMTCDRYPKEINGLEERLKSRFGWGLTICIEPPELETRAAILMHKASQANIDLPNEVAFFIAKCIRSNVRELEGALRRIVANANFTKRAITVEFAKESLRDLLTLQDRLVTIENIQKTVAEYYKLRVAELLSKKRTRSIARPRQLAMTLAKELTSHSLPEIGDAFGGRDHTTVLHACRTITTLRESDIRINEDFNNLLRTLTT